MNKHPILKRLALASLLLGVAGLLGGCGCYPGGWGGHGHHHYRGTAEATSSGPAHASIRNGLFKRIRLYYHFS